MDIQPISIEKLKSITQENSNYLEVLPKVIDFINKGLEANAKTNDKYFRLCLLESDVLTKKFGYKLPNSFNDTLQDLLINSVIQNYTKLGYRYSLNKWSLTISYK